MKKAILISLTLSSLLLGTEVNIIENDKQKNTYNEIDDRYKSESGFAFYQDSNNTKAKENTAKRVSAKCDCNKIAKLLEKIAKENEKQTKIQEKIYKLLKSEIDPEPEKIVVNGKKCIANSSAECYKMPIIAEAKKIPAMKNWLENPSMENTVKYLQWQAKHFQEIFKRGNSFPLAIAQFGADAYPINFQRRGYAGSMEGSHNLDWIRKEKVIKDYKNRFEYILFLGDNFDLDMISFNSLKFFNEVYPDMNIKVVVKNKRTKELLDSMLSSIYSKEGIKIFKKYTIEINSKYFKKFNIFTTPSILVIDKKDNSAQIISNGRFSPSFFTDSMYIYLENKNLIDYKKLSDYAIYNSQPEKINGREEYFRQLYNININKYIKNLTLEGSKK